MISLAGVRDVRFQVLTDRSYVVRYHWRGRSLLCSGRDACVGCQIERPRPVFYIGASVVIGVNPAVRGVVELCQSAHVCIQTNSRTFGKLQGLALNLRRGSPKSEWRAHGASWGEPRNSTMTERDVMDALACVLRVDDPGDGEHFEQWILRVGAMHANLMRGTQLV